MPSISVPEMTFTSLVNTRHYRTVDGSDQTNVFRVAGTYEFPFRFGSQGWGRMLTQVAGGWSLSGMWVYNSGKRPCRSHT